MARMHLAVSMHGIRTAKHTYDRCGQSNLEALSANILSH